VGFIKASWFRGICCGEPIGPWRLRRREAEQDLAAEKLGSYDEWGTFYVGVLGSVQIFQAWMDYDEYVVERGLQSGRREACQRTRPTIVKGSSPSRRIGW